MRQRPTPAILLSLWAISCSTVDPSEGGFGDEASFDGTETGSTPDDVGTGELDPGECLADPKLGAWGYKYQCEGIYLAKLGYTYAGEAHELYIPKHEVIPFGASEEPYEQAKVIACCGEYDPGKPLADQPQVAENCLLDFRQQACISMAVGLEALIQADKVPWEVEDVAISIQNFIASHGTECIAGLLADDYDPATSLQARWYPGNGPWGVLGVENVYIDVLAFVNDVSVPDGGPAICTDLNDNNGNVFSDAGEPLDIQHPVSLDEGRGRLVGPVFHEGSVHASHEWASSFTTCDWPNCSSASFSTSVDEFALDSMRLYADGPVTLSNGSLSETVRDARVELYTQARGWMVEREGRLLYEIPAGAGQFIVVGNWVGGLTTIVMSNESAIQAVESGGMWSLKPFDLVFDDAGDTWRITVESTTWFE